MSSQWVLDLSQQTIDDLRKTFKEINFPEIDAISDSELHEIGVFILTLFKLSIETHFQQEQKAAKAEEE